MTDTEDPQGVTDTRLEPVTSLQADKRGNFSVWVVLGFNRTADLAWKLKAFDVVDVCITADAC